MNRSIVSTRIAANPRRHHAAIRAWRRWLFTALALVCVNFGSAAWAQEAGLKVGGTGTTLGTVQLLAKAFEQANPGVSVEVLSSLGSTGGIKAVIGGAINIGLSARPLTDDERKQGVVAREYGRSPLALAVSRTLAVTGIAMTQLVDIYAAKMNQWPDGTPVRLVLRPETDVNTMLLKAMSPQMRDAVTAAGKRPGMLFALTDQESSENIERIPGAVGPGALCEILAGGSRLKPLTLDGVAPSPAAIADGSYPVYHRFYMVTGAKPDALAERFIAFVQSEPGRRILTDTGHWVPSNGGAR